jgi:hypothetical protein
MYVYIYIYICEFNLTTFIARVFFLARTMGLFCIVWLVCKFQSRDTRM